MNIEINKVTKNPAIKLAIKLLYLKLIRKLIFDFLYGQKKHFIMNCDDIQTKYTTIDEHSKHWFFPRYKGKKIHEPVITKMLINTLNKTDIFVDIGTHLGYFTCIAGKILTNGKVYGFEIDKLAFNILKKNIELNDLINVELHNYGVSDKNGYVKIPKITRPSPTLSFSTSIEKNYRSVKSVNLDDFFKNKNDKPNIIKIDVEGAELLVLKGMKNLLEKESLTLFLEIHGRSLDNFGTDSKEIISYLQNKGYIVYEIINHRSDKKNIKGRLKKLEEDSLIDYNTMVYIIKKSRGLNLKKL